MNKPGPGHRAGKAVRFITGLVAVLIMTSVMRADLPANGHRILQLVIIGVGMLLLLAVAYPGQVAVTVRRRLLLISIGCLAGFCIAELALRILEPFPILLRGGRILLPVGTKSVLSGHGIAGLDESIVVTFNSLGLRGPEPPNNRDDYLTIICVGGSTTQCAYLSDGRTWPDRLATRLSESFEDIWLNNAGLDGHSTFGHLQLMDQYICAIRPRVVLFLVGLNDVRRTDLTEFDTAALVKDESPDAGLMRTLRSQLVRHSDVFAVLDNLRRQRMARMRGLTHASGFSHGVLADADTVVLSEDQRQKILRDFDDGLLLSYRNRLVQLVSKCRESDIRPVFITQPVLYGRGTDDVTGVNLETVAIGDSDGWTEWQILQRYNDMTISVGKELSVPVIPAGERLPKSSRFFYDLTHYNNAGAAQVALLIDEGLTPLLQQWYPE